MEKDEIINLRIVKLCAEKVDEIDKYFGRPVCRADQYLVFGNGEFAIGDYFKALDYYAKALEIDPKYADAWNNIGIIAELFNQSNKAIRAYQRAIEITPTHTVAQKGLSRLLSL